MKHFLSILLVLLLVSCGHRYETSKELEKEFGIRSKQKNDTLIVGHEECTECLDVYINQGELTIPPDIEKDLKMISYYDIKVCGKFPMELIDMTTFNFDPHLKFRIVGKVIKADTNNAIGSVPLFYVEHWEQFQFDRQAWLTKGDLNSYPARPKMIEDIIKNFMFVGQHVSALTNLLGEPNHYGKNEIVYDIEEKYVSDIDPISSTYFAIKFDKDSIITSRTLATTKNGR